MEEKGGTEECKVGETRGRSVVESREVQAEEVEEANQEAESATVPN